MDIFGQCSLSLRKVVLRPERLYVQVSIDLDETLHTDIDKFGLRLG